MISLPCNAQTTFLYHHHNHEAFYISTFVLIVTRVCPGIHVGGCSGQRVFVKVDCSNSEIFFFFFNFSNNL
ncbi:hypothetical protein HYC85_016895 [Camellia sinensis]|uniref:Uncharacterized protein n=1 Tax=Camellia sinensis TaxID=4442 RepID=A0A7J7H256_CAMSI|nr:hypothetical protein HYC85_016895 [Camellia sinensis]